MRLFLILVVALLGNLSVHAQVTADPEADRDALRAFYAKRFPNTPLEDHKDGVYAIDADAKSQWQEMEEFPPYEIAVDEGEILYASAFANGSGYEDCFADGAVQQNYPVFDEASQQVVTLEMAINQCREQHEEQPLEYASAQMRNLEAYIAYQSRGNAVAVALPQTPEAMDAYQEGKRFYNSRRGQLNFACVSCHVQLVGSALRAERLSASLGHVTHWPVYRFKWQEVGGLHKRFQECNAQVGAEAFALQSQEYRQLEYFLAFMSNGLELNGPATRK